MATKIFTTIPGPCPFGYKNDIDDHLCRVCPYFYRAGTGMFFWCNHPVESVPKTPESVPKTRKTVPKATKDVPKTKKKGRPAKNAILRPVKTRKKKNG